MPLGPVKFACTHVSMCGQMPTGRCIYTAGVYAARHQVVVWGLHAFPVCTPGQRGGQKFVQTNLSKINTNVCRNSCFKMAVST